MRVTCKQGCLARVCDRAIWSLPERSHDLLLLVTAFHMSYTMCINI